MNRYSEDDLIAYHLGEPCETDGIRDALERDPALAELSESILLTLRVLSAEPVPRTDAGQAWERLRATLPPTEIRVRRRSSRLRTFWSNRSVFAPGIGMALLAMLLLAVVALAWRSRSPRAHPAGALARPQPSVPLQDPEMEVHLDRAERWLTEVNHTSESMDPAERAEAEGLLLNNAFYVRSAREHGDLPDAVVLERLGRVLTAADHERAADESGWHVRVEMNTNGLLLDIRILRQNQTRHTGDSL